MSDFYSVLKQSIIDRGLKSPSARQEVYAQARTAMIRQLWSYDPPLAEHEIDARIGAFDRTVERIETDLAASFAKPGANRAAAAKAEPAPKRPVPVFEGYDQDADYAPVTGRRTERTTAARHDAGRDPRYLDQEEQEAVEIVRFARRFAHDPLADRSAAIEQALRTGEHEPPAEAEPHEADSDHADTESYSSEGEDFVRENERGGYGEDAHDGYRSRNDDDEAAQSRFDDAEDGEPVGSKQALWTRLSWNQLSERDRVRVLVGAIAALVVVLVVVASAIIFSLFSGSGETINPSAPASPSGQQGAEGAANVAQSFVVFDGRDPTVFESAPGNPVRLDHDASGSFARVTSSTSDAGVRVSLGPGLANRLAGRSVRVTLVARAARENGAPNMRFAYQSGVALSPWQTANLSSSYTSTALTWRVPQMRTDPSGDYLLIEPGIPGDGTAVEIQSIKIDLLASQPS